MMFTTPLAESMAASLTLLESTGQVDPLTWLIYNAGSLGLVFFLMATGQLYSKPQVKKMQDDDDKEKQWLRDELTARDKILEGIRLQLMGQTIPAINNTARVFEQLPTGSGDGLMALVREMHDQLTKLTEEQSPAEGADDGVRRGT